MASDPYGRLKPRCCPCSSKDTTGRGWRKSSHRRRFPARTAASSASQVKQVAVLLQASTHSRHPAPPFFFSCPSNVPAFPYVAGFSSPPIAPLSSMPYSHLLPSRGITTFSRAPNCAHGWQTARAAFGHNPGSRGCGRHQRICAWLRQRQRRPDCTTSCAEEDAGRVWARDQGCARLKTGGEHIESVHDSGDGSSDSDDG